MVKHNIMQETLSVFSEKEKNRLLIINLLENQKFVSSQQLRFIDVDFRLRIDELRRRNCNIIEIVENGKRFFKLS